MALVKNAAGILDLPHLDNGRRYDATGEKAHVVHRYIYICGLKTSNIMCCFNKYKRQRSNRIKITIKNNTNIFKYK